MKENFIPKEAAPIINEALLAVSPKITWKSGKQANVSMKAVTEGVKDVVKRVIAGEQIPFSRLCELLKRFEEELKIKFINKERVADVNAAITKARSALEPYLKVPEVKEAVDDGPKDTDLLDLEQALLDESSNDDLPNEYKGAWGKYSREMKKFELLTRDQEIVLGTAIQAQLKGLEVPLSELRRRLDTAKKRFQKYCDYLDIKEMAGDRLGDTIKEYEDFDVLAASNEIEELEAKISSISTSIQKPREQLINANLRLVLEIALGCPYVRLEDAVEDGNTGLIIAAEKFDPERGYKFHTYARWWIRQAIFRAFVFKERTLHIPIDVFNDIVKITQISSYLYNLLKRSPTNAEIALEIRGRSGVRQTAIEAIKARRQVVEDDKEPSYYEIRDEMLALERRRRREFNMPAFVALAAEDKTDLIPESEAPPINGSSPIDAAWIRSLKNYLTLRHIKSLDEPVNDDVEDGDTIVSSVAYDYSTDPFPKAMDNVVQKELSPLVRMLLANVKEPARGILVRRFGLDGMPEESLREVGKNTEGERRKPNGEVGLSAERIRQLQSEGMGEIARILKDPDYEDLLADLKEHYFGPETDPLDVARDWD